MTQKQPDETAIGILSAEASVVTHAAWRRALLDYLELTKPEITLLVTMSAFMGFLFGSPGMLALGTMAALLTGVTLTSAGVGALNHFVEWELDSRMRRTMNRPIPAGRVSPARARTFGSLLVCAGLGVLCPLTNPLTGVLGALAAILYVLVYTPLKRVTTWNTLIGTLPGALPAMGGWTAATGRLDAGAWVMLALLAAWQMPHFLSLAWMYKKDYGRARYAMLPVVEPDGRSTVVQTLFFTLLTAVVGLLPFLLGNAGPVYALGAVVGAAVFVAPATAFYRSRTVADARRVLMASVRYIPLLLFFQIIDRFV